MRRIADSDDEAQEERLERQLHQLERKQRKLDQKIIEIKVQLCLLRNYTTDISTDSTEETSSVTSNNSDDNNNETNNRVNDRDNDSEQQLQIGNVVSINNPGPSQENTGKIFAITPKGYYKLETVRGNIIRRLAKNLTKL